MDGRRLIAVVLVTLGLAGLAGCWKPGGRGISSDAYTYISTSFEPKTVSVIDTRTGQTIWSYDVPVGRQLNFQFAKSDNPQSAAYPDKIKWSEVDAGRLFGTLSNEQAVPGRDGRRIDLKIRPVPENPVELEKGSPTGGYG